jgi:hypothetical protein
MQPTAESLAHRCRRSSEVDEKYCRERRRRCRESSGNDWVDIKWNLNEERCDVTSVNDFIDNLTYFFKFNSDLSAFFMS